MIRILLLSFTLLLLHSRAEARDLTISFQKLYGKSKISSSEKVLLKDYQYYLVPGILSETFIYADKRSVLDFSFITTDYFDPQKKHLEKLGFSVERLSSSSQSVEDIKLNIRDAFRRTDKKSFFITHSLGGLALLEELILNEAFQDRIAGIIFIQSPFQGSPVADVFMTYPFHMDKWLRPVLPFFNTSEDTISYLGTKERKQFMRDERVKIEKLLRKIPVLTISGVANGYKSLFRPAIDLMDSGCIKNPFNSCLTPKLFNGPYDESDGMVPYQSSKLLDADFVRLEGADHGELVVNIPFASYNKDAFLEALLRLMIHK